MGRDVTKIAWKIWTKIFSMFGLNWVTPALWELLMFTGRLYGVRKKVKSLWWGPFLSSLWTLWLARNWRLFDERHASFHELWERERLFWQPYFPRKKNTFMRTISNLNQNWDAIIFGRYSPYNCSLLFGFFRWQD